MRIPTKSVGVILFVLVGIASQASSQGSWRDVASGTRVRVRVAVPGSGWIDGRFQGMRNDSVRLLGERGPQTVHVAAIVAAERFVPPDLRKVATIGVLGLVAGAVIGNRVGEATIEDRPCRGDYCWRTYKDEGVLLYTIGGALVGGIVGGVTGRILSRGSWIALPLTRPQISVSSSAGPMIAFVVSLRL